MSQLGATFYPGGVDDYYIPEVVAPAPQRVMPEVPQNMQNDLQRMESQARHADAQQSAHSRISSMSAAIETVQPPGTEFKPFHDDNTQTQPHPMSATSDSAPSFSPFPKVKGDNVPPSDEEKEEILYNARQHVLHSNNVSMQLSWARDALAYVETCAESAQRADPNAARAQTPKIEHELRMDAVNIVNYLSGQDHPEALFIRSKWMEFGKFGRRVDKKEAYLGYKRAAEQGWGRAHYRMGMLYENSNDFDKAIIHYNKGLDLNDSAAAYRLGMMNLMGQHGYRKDYQRGIELISQSAETADEDAPQGAYVYGMLISKDLPDIEAPESLLPYDATAARLFIEKAAYLGFSKAQLKMGQAYELCQLGCDFNPSYSLHYYGLAARQGNAEAALGVSRWFLFGYDGYFAKNEQLAYQYAEQATADKIATGYFAMGYFFEIGIYVKKDLVEAKRWYQLAYDGGNSDAGARIESLNGNKSLTKEDHETKTLGRIKSKHGSMKGKRPAHLANRGNQVMPTLSEDKGGMATPPASISPGLKPMGLSPGQSPGHSPRQRPQDAGVEFPDPEKMVNKPPAFTVNLNNGGAQQQTLPIRSSSAAPYPEDGRPAPLNLARSKSTAPYPEDDVAHGAGARLGPQGTPKADRPSSAFGIRPQPGNQNGRGGPGPGPGAGPGYNGGPGAIPPAGTTPGRGGRASSGGRGAPGAGWEPQGQPGYGPPGQQGSGMYDNYRRDYREDAGPPHGGGGGYDAGGRGGGPRNDPAHNRLQKQNPGVNRPGPGQFGGNNYGNQGPGGGGNYPPGPGPQQGGQGQGGPGGPGGPGYQARTSSRPAQFGDSGRMSDEGQRPGSTRPDPAAGGRPSPGPGGRPPVQLKDDSGGRSSAPPTQAGRPQPPQQRPTMSSNQSASTTTSKPPAGQGPATFEEMGIQQGNDKDDCVVM